MFGRSHTKTWATLLVVALCLEHFQPVICKRGSSYGSRGGASRHPTRGSSIRSRISSALGGNRHSGYSPRGGGHSGGGGSRLGRLFGGNKHRNNYGNPHAGGGMLGRGRTGSGGGGLLGGLGRSRNRHMGGGGYKNSMFRSSGIGSRSRSSTFKNMLVGAAGGILAYQAGKYIIKSLTSPMRWNNRQYYWGQQYHPAPSYGPGGHSRTMCRMPIDPSDPVLGNVYMADQTRPKEIVWSCEYHEECCGYECCPPGQAQYGSHTNYGQQNQYGGQGQTQYGQDQQQQYGHKDEYGQNQQQQQQSGQSEYGQDDQYAAEGA